jgi:two-component system response regulator LytT
MKILIVEDETAAYESLVEILNEIDPSIEVIGNTESVSQTIKWLNEGPLPDLILMDIHLSDGPAFLIFDHVEIEIPIIFTTAYDEYAIEAFKVNSIDYLLKPIKSADLERAINKFEKLSRTNVIEYLSKLNQLTPTPAYKSKLLVPFKDKLLPIDLQEVSFFYSTDKNTSIGLKDGNTFSYPKTLENIFSTLNPANFYRANKQFIIARNAVKNITIWFDSRLLVTLNSEVPERIYISKNKAADFKEWLVNE